MLGTQIQDAIVPSVSALIDRWIEESENLLELPEMDDEIEEHWLRAVIGERMLPESIQILSFAN